MKEYKGRIVKIKKYQDGVAYLKQGVKGSDQYKYDNYLGGNGTYVINREYNGTVLEVTIYVFNIEKSFTVDIYNDVLAIAKKKKISAKLLSTIKSHLNDEIDLDFDDENGISFDVGILLN